MLLEKYFEIGQTIKDLFPYYDAPSNGHQEQTVGKPFKNIPIIYDINVEPHITQLIQFLGAI